MPGMRAPPGRRMWRPSGRADPGRRHPVPSGGAGAPGTGGESHYSPGGKVPPGAADDGQPGDARYLSGTAAGRGTDPGKSPKRPGSAPDGGRSGISGGKIGTLPGRSGGYLPGKVQRWGFSLKKIRHFAVICQKVLAICAKEVYNKHADL